MVGSKILIIGISYDSFKISKQFDDTVPHAIIIISTFLDNKNSTFFLAKIISSSFVLSP